MVEIWYKLINVHTTLVLRGHLGVQSNENKFYFTKFRYFSYDLTKKVDAKHKFYI